MRQRADYIIDTSNLLTRELKHEIEKIFVEGKQYNNIIVTVMSFGFKYGIPRDSDLVFDVRFCRIHIMFRSFARRQEMINQSLIW